MCHPTLCHVIRPASVPAPSRLRPGSLSSKAKHVGWYVGALKKYAQFEGRARRKEYWMYSLFSSIFAFIAGLIGMVLTVATHSIAPVVLIIAAYLLANFLPHLAVTVRRLHDTGRPGGWCFITFVPYVGGIILLVLCCQDSQPHNQYGPNPKDPSPGFYGNGYDAPAYPGYGQPLPPPAEPYYGGRHSA